MKKRILTAPNILTLSRFIFAPIVFALILTNHRYLAFAFYAIGALTDAFDGYFARRFKEKSKIGSLLDALADRIFVILVVIALFITNNLTLFMELLFASWVVGEAIIGFLLTRKIHRFYLWEIHRDSIRFAAVFTFSTVGAIVLGIPIVCINILIIISLAAILYSFFDYLNYIFDSN